MEPVMWRTAWQAQVTDCLTQIVIRKLILLIAIVIWAITI